MIKRITSQMIRVCTLLLLAVGLSSCEAAVVAPSFSLPTLVAQATVPLTATVSPSPTIDLTAVPATWTPNPATRDGHAYVDPNKTPLPDRTPTAVLTIPTRTPVPPTPTITLTPTNTSIPPTRGPIILPPTNELGPSKLGIHVIQNNDPRIMEFVRRAQPAVVKAVGDLGFLSDVKEASPRTITIGRVDDAASQQYDGNPEEKAREYVNKHLQTYRLNPGVDYWEGWNEPDPNDDGKLLWYGRYEQERVRQMALHGFRTAIGGFPTGVPELEEFYLILPAIEEARQHSGILTLHEYSAPDMLYLYGAPLPGQPAYPDRGALTFRYRWFYREILEPNGMVIPLAITEAGVDGIIGNRPGPGGKGWHDFASYWVSQGWGSSGAEAFINQLAWYDVGVREDGYVIGFTIFTAGDSPGWRSYEIDSILPELGDYVISQR